MISLPLPVSPLINTETSDFAIRSAISNRRTIARLCTTAETPLGLSDLGMADKGLAIVTEQCDLQHSLHFTGNPLVLRP